LHMEASNSSKIQVVIIIGYTDWEEGIKQNFETTSRAMPPIWSPVPAKCFQTPQRLVKHTIPRIFYLNA
jgi:hypothetical protein